MPKVYNYSALDGSFLVASEAALDPIDREPLVPANATLTAPPKTATNQVAVWDGKAWAVKPDFRGLRYWMPDGSTGVITSVGVSPPSGYLTTEPKPTLAALKAKAVSYVTQKRDAVIEKRISLWTATAQKDWADKSALLDAFDAGDIEAGKTLASYMPSLLAKQVVASGGDPAKAMAERIRGYRDALRALKAKAESLAGDAVILIEKATTETALNTVMDKINATIAQAEADYDARYQLLKAPSK